MTPMKQELIDSFYGFALLASVLLHPRTHVTGNGWVTTFMLNDFINGVRVYVKYNGVTNSVMYYRKIIENGQLIDDPLFYEENDC